MKKETAAHVPFMIINPSYCKRRLGYMRNLGKSLSEKFPNLKNNLKTLGVDAEPGDYMLSALMSALFLSVLFAVLVFALSHYMENPMDRSLLTAIGTLVGMFVLILFIFIKYPSIQAKKKAQEIDKHLMFALKDLLLHTASGASLYNALVSVARSNYGEASEVFHGVAKEINSGTSTDMAFERLAKRTESEYLKKVLWQLVNTLRAGGNLKDALSTIVRELITTQRANIVGYANELNLWSLIYMIFAVAAPTIGLTMMIILVSFVDIGINKAAMLMFIALTLMIQIDIISLIKSRRPMVEF
jgi:flagellar protein FlaJ